MPINPNSARGVIIWRYHVATLPHAHSQKLYMDSNIINVDGICELDGVVNPFTSENWLVHDIIRQLNDRLVGQYAGFAVPYEVTSVECYRNDLTDPLIEEFVGFDLSDYSDLVAGIQPSIPPAFLQWNMQSADRSNARFVFFGVGQSFPLRLAGTVPPVVDDDTVEWFLTRSNVPFATNDGEGVSRFVSLTGGYNRKLKRLYEG